MSKDPLVAYSERLWPSPALMITLLLIIPAVMLMIVPLNAAIALPVAIAAYLLIAGSLMLVSPSIRVQDGELFAGSARVPLSLLGEVTQLDDSALRRILGQGADARAFLLVRGYIHRGVHIELHDVDDPTPYWVLTSRRPVALAAAVEAARA